MKFYIADAFTTEIFGGNPAGVVILDEDKDFPEAEIKRKTAAELRYTETAFIKPLHRAESDDCRQNSGWESSAIVPASWLVNWTK